MTTMSNSPAVSGGYAPPRTPNTRRSLARDADTPPPATFSSPLHSRKLQHVTIALPQDVSLHNAPPLEILQRLLNDVKRPTSRHHARYSAFVSSEDEELVQLLERCIRKEVWDLSSHAQQSSRNARADLCADIEALKAIGGDTGYFGRAIYLHIVEFANGAVRLYVGQAFNLASRINNQHVDFRYRRDHPSLHNFAVDRSTNDVYVVLAQVRENTQSDLVLNLLEMWMALWLRTLPDETLEAWLGAERDEELRGERGGKKRRKVFGLNVASPLDQGDREASMSAFQMLKDSKDEMAREYFWDVRKRPRPVVQAVVAKDPGSWTQYLPHFLAFAAIGFVAGRWSSFFARRI